MDDRADDPLRGDGRSTAPVGDGGEVDGGDVDRAEVDRVEPERVEPDSVEPDSVEPDSVEPDLALLEGLAPSLLWRVGRLSDDGPVTVRVGFATAAPLFAELPRLRNATDGEVEQAVRERTIAVEWVGPRPR
jgi:hypothetical protein